MDYLEYMNYIHSMAQENVLAHHGIKGQKWGIRRFENEDGSLTPEGKARYYNSDGTITKKGFKRINKNYKIFSNIINTDPKMIELDKKASTLSYKLDITSDPEEVRKVYAELISTYKAMGAVINEHLNQMNIQISRKDSSKFILKHSDDMYYAVIAHHGIKGQEWGKRKYQYEDGSLTPEGKKHYGVGDGTNKKDPPTKDKKQVSKQNPKPKDKPAEEKEKTPEELQAEAAKKAARKKKIAIAAGVTAAAIVGIVLAKKYHDMKIQNGELQTEAAKGEERFNDLKSKYDLQGKDIAKLKGENSFLQTNSKAMAGTIDKLSKEKAGVKKELFEARKTNVSLETQARGMSKTISDLRAQNGNLKKDFYKEKKTIEAGHARTVSLLESNLKVANIQAEAGNQLANVSPVHQRTYRKILEGISNGKVLFGYKGSK